MPLRYAQTRAAHAGSIFNRSSSSTRPHRPLIACSSNSPFHSTSALRDDIDSKNHYETLNVQPNASAGDIKKSFYALSKTHHPDHNRNDPLASRRFVRISEAYSVLGHTDKRARYDRDVLRSHQQAAHPRGSHHGSSAGPAGGRPASGLSRRRGTYQGPPPSFYRSGGWGAHGEKRQAAHEETTGGADSTAGSGPKEEAAGGGFGWAQAGMGPGQDPFGHHGEVPHFDRAAHTRTQQRSDERRARRMAREGHFPHIPDVGALGNFFLVMGVLGASIGFPYLALRAWYERGAKQRTKATLGPKS